MGLDLLGAKLLRNAGRILQRRHMSKNVGGSSNTTVIGGKEYPRDEWTNITPRILQRIDSKLHLQKHHPLCIMRRAIENHFYSMYRVSRGPIFAVLDNISPVVSTKQNFDSMLIPEDHISRKKQDNYYINKNTMLRAHTSAHEAELIRSGFDAFLTIGDVYRRDTVDPTHYPIFHQVEGVRLFAPHALTTDQESEDVVLFEDGYETEMKQSCHTLEASKLTEYDLKQALVNLVQDLFGRDVEYRWIDAYFPFTHPSFEMEIMFEGEWVEMLGCGVLRQQILDNCGADQKIGWAFGLGLERLAMKLFNIPDIRYFWSKDQSFLEQFHGVDETNFRKFNFTNLLSKHPLVMNDISFWLNDDTNYDSNDFYDVVRTYGGDLVENVHLFDVFKNPKNGRTSHCYRVFYRHLTRPLERKEIAEIDANIKKTLLSKFSIQPRWIEEAKP